MAEGEVRNKEEVIDYILTIRAKLMINTVENLIIMPRKDGKNKQCMVDLGLRHNDVADILCKIDEQHYRETVPDIDIPGEWLWIFDYLYNGHELYIKINCVKE